MICVCQYLVFEAEILFLNLLNCSINFASEENSCKVTNVLVYSD